MQINLKQFVAPAGALFSLFCFILPWFSFSAVFVGSQSLLGIQSGLLAWLVALLAIAALAVSVVVNFIPSNAVPAIDFIPKNFSAVGVIAAIAVIGISGLALFLMLIIAFFNTGSNGLAAINLSVGWYGSFLGFLIAIGGAILLAINPPLPQQNQS